MQLIVKILTSFFVVLFISGCGYKVIMVPQKCVIPNTDRPIIDTKEYNTTLGESKQCVTNYFRTKEAYEILLEAVKLCQ